MYETRIRLGNCLISILSEIELKTDWETEAFLEKGSEEEPTYRYTLEEVSRITEPQGVSYVKWGQWWIYNPGGRERHVRRMDDDTEIPYVCYSQAGEREYKVAYIPAIRPHLGLNRFTLSLMALEGRMLSERGLILHCSFVEYQGVGILFSAPSRTGKSTQADLWEKYRPCRIINGDRALIQKQGEDFCAYGWPVSGSSEISRNTCAPIRAIVQISQGKENRVEEERPGERLNKLIPEVTVNRWNTKAYMQALDLMEELIGRVPVVSFVCDISENAVDTLDQYLFPGEGSE